MNTRSWSFELEDGIHTVELTHGIFAIKDIAVDGTSIGKKRSFWVGGHYCSVLTKMLSIKARHDLAIDGRSLTTGKQVLFPPLEIRYRDEYLIAVLSVKAVEVMEELLEKPEYYYVWTSSDGSSPGSWLGKTPDTQPDQCPELASHCRCGEVACEISPGAKQDARNFFLTYCGDAFCICDHPTDQKLLDQGNSGAIATMLTAGDFSSIDDAIDEALEEIKRFEAIYHVSYSWDRELLVVTTDHGFKRVLEKHFGASAVASQRSGSA